MNPEILTSNTADSLMQIVDAVRQSFVTLAMDIGLFLPKLTIAVIILCIGVIAAKIIRTLATKILISVNIDALCESSGLKNALSKVGVTKDLAIIVPKIMHFFILILTIKIASENAGFEDITAFLNQIFAFAPKLSMAFIIMVIGLFVGDMIQIAVFVALDAKGLDYANTLSKLVFGLIFIVFLTVSLSQVGIETELLKSTVKIILLGVSFALALALGLGLRQHAANVVAAVYVRDIYKKGVKIEIDGKLLQIMGIGPVTTKLQNEEGDFVIIPNTDLVTTKVKGIL